MTTNLLHDRGRGPEIVGTRITVYNLLPYFLDPTVTEEYVATLYDLTLEQVAAARAYALNNSDAVLATHRKIEARLAAGNPPEVVEQAKQTHALFANFQRSLAERKRAERNVPDNGSGVASGGRLPDFQEWVSLQPAPAPKRS